MISTARVLAETDSACVRTKESKGARYFRKEAYMIFINNSFFNDILIKLINEQIIKLTQSLEIRYLMIGIQHDICLNSCFTPYLGMAHRDIQGGYS